VRYPVLVALLGLTLASCDESASPVSSELANRAIDCGVAVLDGQDTVFVLKATKWRGGARGAVSITYDAPWGTFEIDPLVTDAAAEQGIRMDMEFVSEVYQEARWQHLPEIYRYRLIPQGIRFFGHGHTHALHDTMTYEAAYESFSQNFDLMTSWGLRPRAYAYPGSAGRKVSTQTACRDAGFICARGAELNLNKAIIVPGEELAPENWFYLPSVVMGNASHRYLDRHEKLLPVLDRTVEKGGWVILMYHAIGIPSGWSYYPFEDFRQDIEAIAARDLWSANFDAAAVYTMEREALTLDILPGVHEPGDGLTTIRIKDGLADDLYDEPLTFEVIAYRTDVTVEIDERLIAGPGRRLLFEAIPTDLLVTVSTTRPQ
jgi:hypothetical protein